MNLSCELHPVSLAGKKMAPDVNAKGPLQKFTPLSRSLSYDFFIILASVFLLGFELLELFLNFPENPALLASRVS